jgi:undecaprenyl diphosphate synthase
MNWHIEQELNDKNIQQELINSANIPNHIAIIMDGNGRWAEEKGLSRSKGHKEGLESVRDIVKASSTLGVKYLTLYAFSIENWKRPFAEVEVLMSLLEIYLKNEVDELHKNKVRIKTIGKFNSLPKTVQKLLLSAVEKTKNNTGLTLTLALSYGARWDIVRAVQLIALDVRRGNLSPEDINEGNFSQYLSTKDIPDPDLMIRTSGEFRLSNFLLWEVAYGEIYVSNLLFPQFRRNDLYEAIKSYSSRERRFGKTSAQIKNEKKSIENDSYIKKVFNAIKSI